MRSFALFCALLRSLALFCGLAFALFCALLRAFACFCVRPRLERPRLGTAELRMVIVDPFPRKSFTLPAPQKNFFFFFFSCLPGNFALKTGGDFW